MKNPLLLLSFLFLLFGFRSDVLIASESGYLKSSAEINITSLSWCDIPSGLYTGNITESGATLHWSHVPEAQSYSVQIRLLNGSWNYVSGSPFMNNSVVINWLDPGTTYEWRVRSNCGYGYYSYWSSPVNFTTLGGSGICEPPSWLETYNIGQTTATWDWSPASGAVNYSVQWRYPGGSWHNLPGGPWHGTLLNIGGLQPNTDYEWRVRSNCYNGMTSDWSYPESFTTLGSTCHTPSGLHTTNITSTSATFNWSPVSGAQSYSVQIRLPNGSWTYLQGSPFSDTDVTVSGLTPGTQYEWRVRANCGYYHSSYWSQEITFVTQGSQACLPPETLATYNITQTTATWDWSPVSGAISYSVQWRYAGGTWHNLPGGPWGGTLLHIGGLHPGTTYEWRVRSNCGYGVYSDWSAPAVFTTLGSTCSTPVGLYSTNINDTTATLHWSPVSGAQSYSVQLRFANGAWNYIAGSPFSDTTVTLTNLSPGSTYEWRVRTNCGYGIYSIWSAPSTFTTTGTFACNAPAILNTFHITYTTATWDWSPVSGAINYSVQWRYPGGNWNDLQGGPWAGTLLHIGGLQPGTDYEWRVQAHCANGMSSAWSNPASFTTLGANCLAPIGLYTSGVTETSATFHWSPVQGAASYSVQIRLPNGIWSFIAGSPFSDTTAIVNNLNPGTTYQWRVRSNCAAGLSSYWSSPVSFTTTGTTSCIAPEILSTYNVTQTTATWDWSPVSGAISYSVQWRYAGGVWHNLQGGPWNVTSLNIGGLIPGTAYEWRVRSNCGYSVHSEWSAPAYFTTPGISCGTPGGLHTSNVTMNMATFNWSPVSGAENYTVQLRVLYGNWMTLPGSPFMNTSVTVDWLNPGTTYEWRVRANCPGGEHSYWSYASTFTTEGTFSCGTPDTLVTINITQTTATWDWTPVGGAISYTVQWRLAGGAWHYLPGGPWYGTLLNIGGLQPGTDYEWRVRANCAGGIVSDWSIPASFTTLGSTCSTPTGLSTSNITESSATFHWDEVPGAQTYSVQTRLPYGNWSYVPGSPFTDTWATVDWFSPGTTYEWRVRANCSYGHHSSWSSTVTFTTNGSPGNNNDFCSDATYLTVNNTCVNTEATNVGATPSSPPPAAGCNSTGYKDVWFKFNMPNINYPLVTIRTTAGSLTDAVMEVYVGSNCSYLSLLGCEDDNNNGNGSDMPVISLAGGPNATIWVRVWGKNGATGTFNICVFNYISNNFTDIEGETLFEVEGETFEQQEVAEEPAVKDVGLRQLTIAPNPASEFVEVSYSLSDNDKVNAIRILDMSGQIVLMEKYESFRDQNFRERIDVSELPPATYILQLITTQGSISNKITVVR